MKHLLKFAEVTPVQLIPHFYGFGMFAGTPVLPQELYVRGGEALIDVLLKLTMPLKTLVGVTTKQFSARAAADLKKCELYYLLPEPMSKFQCTTQVRVSPDERYMIVAVGFPPNEVLEDPWHITLIFDTEE